MNFKNLVDMHSHTIHSFDGHYPVDELIEVSIHRNLKAVAFTDHVEMDFFREKGFDKTADESFDDISRAKEKYKDKIKVCVGAELGQPLYNVQESEELISSKDYDFIIGSVHNLRGKDDFAVLDYENNSFDIDALLKEYFYEEKLLAQWAKFDTFAHLTYPLRYIQGEYKINVDMTKYQKDIDEIFSLLIQNDKPLEINTSGLRQPIGLTLPDVSYIKRFKQLGGKYVTVGSDSHYTEHMGAGIPRGLEIAKECGFDSVLIFEKRKPAEISIEQE